MEIIEFPNLITLREVNRPFIEPYSSENISEASPEIESENSNLLTDGGEKVGWISKK
jgi:hypothetical protein